MPQPLTDARQISHIAHGFLVAHGADERRTDLAAAARSGPLIAKTTGFVIGHAAQT